MKNVSRTEFASVAPSRKESSTATGASCHSQPGSVFAFVRWISNDFGAVVSRIDILRAVATGQRCSTVPYVKPGGEILLRLSGWPKVERVLQLIDAVEALGIDPADAAPDYWHHVHNRLSVNEIPRPTQSRAIRPGFIGGRLRHDAPKPNARHDDRRSCHSRRDDRRKAVANLHMEQLLRAFLSASIACARPATTTSPNSSPFSRPNRWRPILDLNGYLPTGVPMLKRVLALPGQTVCRNGRTIIGRRHRDGRGAGARQTWPAVAGLGRVRCRRRRRSSFS